MRFFDDSELPLIDHEDDALVRRLRALDWPQADAGLKQRSWEQFRRQMREDLPREETVDTADRFEYRRRTFASTLTNVQRAGTGRGTVASERLRIASRCLRRPGLATPRPLIGI
jgi:hypothetical protein